MDYRELSQSLISILIILLFFCWSGLVEFSFGKLLFMCQIRDTLVLIS